MSLVATAAAAAAAAAGCGVGTERSPAVRWAPTTLDQMLVRLVVASPRLASRAEREQRREANYLQGLLFLFLLLLLLFSNESDDDRWPI